MASDDVQTNLRLSAALKERLVNSASENNRSLSAEVASRLELSYVPRDDSISKDALEAMLLDAARRQQDEILAQTLLRDLLATYVRMLYKALPADAKKEEHFEMANELAKDLGTEGNPNIELILSKLFASGNDGPVTAIADVIRRDTKQRWSKHKPGS